MTLAELQAVVAFGTPDRLASLHVLLALAPLLAQRRGVSVEFIYAMQAADFFDAGLDLLASLPHEFIVAAEIAMQRASEALEPERMQQRVPS